MSHVSYHSGVCIPFLQELSREAHAHGAMLVVDATQSLGRMPVPVEGVDFLVASTYKWLLGVHGLGVAYLSPIGTQPHLGGNARVVLRPEPFRP